MKNPNEKVNIGAFCDAKKKSIYGGGVTHLQIRE